MRAAQSEDIGELAAAMALAQAKMPTAKFNQVNPHFKSKYADLASIRDASVPHLSANGLSIVQTPGYDEQNNYVLYTLLLHKSGQWISSIIPLLNAPDKPQAMMGSLTYARRGGWASMTGMATEDDDGNIAGRTLTPSQVEELEQLFSTRNVEEGAFFTGTGKALGYEIASFEDILRADMPRVKSWLQSKEKRA